MLGLSDLIGAICAVVNRNVAGTWQEHGATYTECLPETHGKEAARSPTGALRFADSKFTETRQFTTSSCCRNRFFFAAAFLPLGISFPFKAEYQQRAEKDDLRRTCNHSQE